MLCTNLKLWLVFMTQPKNLVSSGGCEPPTVPVQNRTKLSLLGELFRLFVRTIARGMTSKLRTTAEILDTEYVFSANASLSSAVIQYVAHIQYNNVLFV